MYGFQAEPTPMDANHLARLSELRARFPALRLGFMDHAAGASDEAGWLALLALPFGVSVLEKHVTLARDIKMEDDVSALEPAEFAVFVTRVRSAEDALGHSALTLTAAEQAYRQRAVKVVVSRQSLPAGHRITASDIALLRAKIEPGQSTIERVGAVIDRTLARAVAAGRALGKDDLA
jgi:sialic acid synthase SpsE